MVTFDRRDEFWTSDSDLPAIAAECHRLYNSDEFKQDVLDALDPVLNEHLDTDDVDEEAEAVLRKWLFKDGKGGLFQLRNQIVTNEDADLAEGDVVQFPSRRDGRTITHVVKKADPDDTGVRTVRVTDDGERKISDLSTGLAYHVDDYDIDRSDRGQDAWRAASEMVEEVADD